MRKVKLKTKGMECRSCEQSIEAAVKKLEGVSSVKSDYSTEFTVVEYDESITDKAAIRKKIEEKGFEVGEHKIPLSGRFGTLALALGISAPILIWVGAGTALYQRRKQAKLSRQALPNLVCSIDADCLPGFVCSNGYCVPVESV